MSEYNFNTLFIQTTLPLEWAPLNEGEYLPASTELSNQNILKIAMGLDEGAHEAIDESAEINHEVQRLEYKVNVILELVAQLVSRDTELPNAIEIKLSADALEWSCTTTPPVFGQTILVKIYLDSRFPTPLILSGEVVSVVQTKNCHRVVLDLTANDELTHELFEKYIFRCHRRQIASLKSKKSTK